jgi:hypothetical protein
MTEDEIFDFIYKEHHYHIAKMENTLHFKGEQPVNLIIYARGGDYEAVITEYDMDGFKWKRPVIDKFTWGFIAWHECSKCEIINLELHKLMKQAEFFKNIYDGVGIKTDSTNISNPENQPPL